MNSSISSFRTEFKVILVALLVVGALELQKRWHVAHAGGEPALLRDFPRMADDLAQQGGQSVILLGNSLTQNGYDMPLLKQELDSAGHGDLHVAKVAVTGSSPIEWYHNYDRNFAARGKSPTAIVVNMSPSGIFDTLPAGYRVGWLANETTWSDVPEVLFKDLQNVEVGGQYLQARVSMLYASRWDTRVGILHQFVPNLMAGMNWVNAGQRGAAPTGAASVKSPPKPKTYSLLSRMLELARRNRTRVVLVAMPAREGYELEPELLDLIQKDDNVTLLDCRSVPALSADGFEDGWHLNPQGAKVFTRHMAELLPQMLARKP